MIGGLDRLEPDMQLVRRTFSLFPSGVARIAARVDDQIEAIIASSFTVGVSLEPPLVLFAIQKSSTTWPSLKAAPSIGVSVLGKEHSTICRQIASRKREERFDGINIHESEAGSVFVPGSPVWLDCAVRSEFEAGDHDVVVLEILGLGFDANLDPLVFHRSSFPLLTSEDVP